MRLFAFRYQRFFKDNLIYDDVDISTEGWKKRVQRKKELEKGVQSCIVYSRDPLKTTITRVISNGAIRTLVSNEVDRFLSFPDSCRVIHIPE